MEEITKEIAKDYVINSIWKYVEDKNVDYFNIRDSAVSILQQYVPCWSGSVDLLPFWACIFNWILAHKVSNIGATDLQMIEVRYKNALESLEKIGLNYCKEKKYSKDSLKNLFVIGKSKHHKWVDFV